MIKLTSLNDLIVSLIGKFLGRNYITFILHPNEEDFSLECISNDYKFAISKNKDGLRVYDNGNVYLIQNILPEDYLFKIDDIVWREAEKLGMYYKLRYYTKKVREGVELRVYEFVKI